MRLDPNTVAAVMVHLLRCPAVAAQALEAGLTGDDLLASAWPQYATLVDALAEYRQRRSDAPSRLVLEQICDRIFYNDSSRRADEATLREFTAYAYDVAESQLNPVYVLARQGVLQQVIDEARLTPALQRASAELDPERRGKLLDELDQMRSSSRVALAASVDIFDPEVMSRLTAKSQIEPTGLDFLDKAIGGLPRTALVGLLAGTGGGKTMFGTQLACEAIIHGRNVMYLQYEQTLEGDTAERFYSYVGGVSRADMLNGFASYPESAKKEIRDAWPRFQKHFRMFPMAGDVENQGTGGVPEIAEIIDRLESQDGWRPALVVVDWLEPLWSAWDGIRRHVRAKDKREEYKFIIAKLKELRDRYQTVVVLLHQLAPGIVEKLSPAVRPEKTMAEEVKSFPNLMNFCFAFGRKDDLTDCMWFTVAKARTAATPARIVRMNALYNRIEDAHDLFVLNDAHSLDGQSAFVPRGQRGQGGL